MKKNLFVIFPQAFRKAYENTAEEQAAANKAAADKATADKAAADKAAADAAANNGDQNDPFKKLNFTPEQQEFFNRKLADERRALQNQNNKTIDELKKLQIATGTTEQQKKELQERINELQRQYLSKEEIQKQEQERTQREFQQQLQQHKSEAEQWKNRFHETAITRALQDEAISFEAFNPNQIIDLLQTRTKLVDEKDTDGNSTGRLLPRVALVESDSEGKPVTLDLTVKEALQRMKNTPDKYGNLFKSTLAGGLGQSGSTSGAGGKGGKPNFSKMSPAEWQEYKKKNPTLAGL